MKHGTLTISFHAYWHCSTGQAGDGDIDLAPRTEPCGLPIAPGRTVRGRLKWAGRELGWSDEKLLALFGQGDETNPDNFSILSVPNARMEGAFANYCRNYYQQRQGKHIAPEVEGLFEDIAATAMDEATGTASDKTLRRIRYAVPVDVSTVVSVRADRWDDLQACVKALRAVGKGKHDGYGWCIAALVDAPTPAAATPVPAGNAFDLTITLQDDIILSASSATTGTHRTLDYVPGSALLGAAARHLFPKLKEQDGALALAKAKISFGNGYFIHQGSPLLPMPFAWHAAKDEGSIDNERIAKDKVWNFAKVEYPDSGIKDRQPVQLRAGWFDPATGSVRKTISTTQTLKTAVNNDRGRYEVAEQGALFGYEAVAAGTQFLARIEVKDGDAALCEIVNQAFSGTTIRLGRSKGTEFGRASCTLVKTEAVSAVSVHDGECILFAESDLCFVDAKGFPSLRPAPKDFGLLGDGWELDEARSYLRFRRYSLWNSKRGGPDAERQVISKGSVIVFTRKDKTAAASVNTRVGIGQGEGLGRILVNPPCLLDKNPRFDATPTPPVNGGGTKAKPDATDILTNWVIERTQAKRFDIETRKLAKQWADHWSKAMRSAGVTLQAAQWMRLDEAARRSSTVDDLLKQLGKPEEENRDTIFGHGRRRHDWTSANKRHDPQRCVARSVLDSLPAKAPVDDRFQLAVFRAAVHHMAANARKAKA